MSNSFIMTESIVRPAKMPYGRLKDNLSAYASVSLIIDDLDRGAMTKTTSGSKTVLSLTLIGATE